MIIEAKRLGGLFRGSNGLQKVVAALCDLPVAATARVARSERIQSNLNRSQWRERTQACTFVGRDAERHATNSGSFRCTTKKQNEQK